MDEGKLREEKKIYSFEISKGNKKGSFQSHIKRVYIEIDFNRQFILSDLLHLFVKDLSLFHEREKFLFI